MIFGKIEYLNLLPFHVFMKKSGASLRYKKGVPSAINHAFKTRRVDAAFISSIESKPYRCLNAGIVAHKKVYSVLVLPGVAKNDTASATSNALAEKLGIKGEVIIGDRALKHFLTTGEGVDLATAWYEAHGLPFVFARLCYHKNTCQFHKHVVRFLKTRTKIPYYLLLQASKKSGLTPLDILWYLAHIHYRIEAKEKKSLHLFFKE